MHPAPEITPPFYSLMTLQRAQGAVVWTPTLGMETPKVRGPPHTQTHEAEIPVALQLHPLLGVQIPSVGPGSPPQWDQDAPRGSGPPPMGPAPPLVAHSGDEVVGLQLRQAQS